MFNNYRFNCSVKSKPVNKKVSRKSYIGFKLFFDVQQKRGSNCTLEALLPTYHPTYLPTYPPMHVLKIKLWSAEMCLTVKAEIDC